MERQGLSTIVIEHGAGEQLAPAGKSGVSVVIPAFNEEKAIGEQIDTVRRVLESAGWPHEIIVVNDGSTDATAAEVRKHGVRLVQFPYNRGYGAALKAGIGVAENECIVITDADGTYPAEALPLMLERAGEYGYQVINDDVDTAVARLEAIVRRQFERG